MTELANSSLVPEYDEEMVGEYTPSSKKWRKAITINAAPKLTREIPDVYVDDSRDALLTPFSKATLKERYLTENESFQDRFANCVRYYANDADHAARMYDYISKLWCMPPTPILSNGGTTKGNLISCFVNEAEDSLEGIVKMWNQNIWIGAKGGGIGSYFGNIRSIGESAGVNGKTSGAFSFSHVTDSLVACISQGSNRRGAGAIYVDIHHPEIEAFLDMRRQAGGDPDRKNLNLHHGVIVDDKFMNAVINNEMYDLISPKTGKVIESVRAQELAAKLVTTRLETGEPYIIFKENVHRFVPEHHKRSGLYPKTSNLCVAGETRILTREGYKPIKSVAGTNQHVWNGKQWSLARVEQTGTHQKLVSVILSNGVKLQVTPYHKWKIKDYAGMWPASSKLVSTSELHVGDSLVRPNFDIVTAGINNNQAHTNGVDAAFILAGNNSRLSDVISKVAIPINYDVKSRLAWLSGFFDNVGYMHNSSIFVESDDESLLHDLRLMITTLGSDSVVSFVESPNRYALIVSNKQAKYLTDLGMKLQNWTMSFDDSFVDDDVLVTDIFDEGRYDDTYCFNEPLEHLGVFEGILTGNCSEILLPTGIDHHGNDRTAICCLFQPNVEKFEEWKDNKQFYKDIGYFLDNVLQDFIDNAGDHFIAARYSAHNERSIGVGVMGFHSFLQSKKIPLGSVMAKSWNAKIFNHHKSELDRVSREIAEERGACPDAAEHGIMERFSYKSAIAPTATVSIICGGTSAGIDAIPANIYTHKTLNGSFEVKNPYLERDLERYGKNTKEVWDSILENEGSVAHLDFLSDHEKDIYKTSFEVDQRVLIELAAQRTPMVDQSQSLNITLAPDCHKRDLWKIHEMAWRLGVKSMYYLRSKSIQTVSIDDTKKTNHQPEYTKIDYETCLSCE